MEIRRTKNVEIGEVGEWLTCPIIYNNVLYDDYENWYAPPNELILIKDGKEIKISNESGYVTVVEYSRSINLPEHIRLIDEEIE